MGWSSGSEVAIALVKSVKENLPVEPAARRDIYVQVGRVLRDLDCDTLDEACGLDEVWDELYGVEPDND